MKTFTIHLENHDDVASTMDKLSWCKGRRFLLVWPKRSRLMQSRLDLVLIQRYCSGMGAQVGIVTQDTDVEGNAIQLGIPVFKTIAQANRSIWRRGRSKKRRLVAQTATRYQKYLELKDYFENKKPFTRSENRFRKPVFISGICAVFVLLLFFLPSADIALAIAESEQRVSLQVRASPEITAPNINGGIPAHEIALEVNGRDQDETTGSVPSPDQFANGIITLTNLTDQSVVVPVGTVVLTLDDPAIRFETLGEIQIQGGVGETAQAPVKAQQPGQNGNVEAGRIRAIAGDIGLYVMVENHEPTAGGSNLTSPAPSRDDYDNLKNRLLDTLEKKALDEMESSLEDGERLLTGTLKLEKVLEEKVQPEVGQPGDHLAIQLRVKYSAWYMLPNELESMINTVMDGGLAPGMVTVPGQPLEIEETSPVVNQNGMEWQVNASRNIRASWKEEDVISAVSGKKPEAAIGVLSGMLQLETPAAIRMHPSWWPRIPFLPIQIHVEMK